MNNTEETDSKAPGYGCPIDWRAALAVAGTCIVVTFVGLGPMAPLTVRAAAIPHHFKPAAASAMPMPTAVIIPKIRVNSPIVPMGLTSDNRMAVPDNFSEVGWFAGSGATIPGNVGNAVLGAHVDNGGTKPTIGGVFKDLHALKVGDDIYVSRAGLSTLHYLVVAIKIYAYDSATTDLIFGPSQERHLNLITCYGTWLPVARTYNKRLVVFATLV
jgi:LPXTG-site transpeptidase (sortase) family protein